MREIKTGKTEIDIRYTNGIIETRDITNQFPLGLNDYLFETVKNAAKKRDAGDIIAYRNIAPVYETEESDYTVHCERCNKSINMHIAHSKPGIHCGLPVTTYYCDDCYRLLIVTNNF